LEDADRIIVSEGWQVNLARQRVFTCAVLSPITHIPVPDFPSPARNANFLEHSSRLSLSH
jgi:hypothetical protein